MELAKKSILLSSEKGVHIQHRVIDLAFTSCTSCVQSRTLLKFIPMFWLMRKKSLKSSQSSQVLVTDELKN